MNPSRWLLTMTVAVAVTASCVGERGVPQDQAPAAAPDVSDVFGDSPGPQWFDRDRRPLDRIKVVSSLNGPEHCGWERAVLLHVQWPPGADERRQYARDPVGVLGRSGLTKRFDPDAELPNGATATGYHTQDVELWLADGHGDYAYLVFEEHVERWPRVVPPVGCD